MIRQEYVETATSLLNRLFDLWIDEGITLDEENIAILVEASDTFKNMLYTNQRKKKIPSYLTERAISKAFANELVTIDRSKKTPSLVIKREADLSMLKLEDRLDIVLYLYPVIDKREHVLFNFRECGNCGTMFHYVQEKAKFCSAYCQGFAGRERRKLEIQKSEK